MAKPRGIIGGPGAKSGNFIGGGVRPAAGPQGKEATKRNAAFQAAAKAIQKNRPTKAALRKRDIRQRQKTNRALGAGARFAGGQAG